MLLRADGPGKPALPIETLKAAWAAGKLKRTVQLTVSGRLGPCDLTNITLLLTPDEQVWLGGLEGDGVHDAFVRWAEDCHAAGERLPLPAVLEGHRFERWPVTEAVA